MSESKDRKPDPAPSADDDLIVPPVDVVDGIPDRQANPPAWKYVLMAAIFLGWVGFLVYCLIAGRL